MPTFRLCCSLTVSAYTEVEAQTAEEAIAIAATRGVADIGRFNPDQETEEWLPDSDGEPADISVEGFR